MRAWRYYTYSSWCFKTSICSLLPIPTYIMLADKIMVRWRLNLIFHGWKNGQQKTLLAQKPHQYREYHCLTWIVPEIPSSSQTSRSQKRSPQHWAIKFIQSSSNLEEPRSFLSATYLFLLCSVGVSSLCQPCVVLQIPLYCAISINSAVTGHGSFPNAEKSRRSRRFWSAAETIVKS